MDTINIKFMKFTRTKSIKFAKQSAKFKYFMSYANFDFLVVISEEKGICKAHVKFI